MDRDESPSQNADKPADTKAAEAARLAATRQRELDSAISSITKAYGDAPMVSIATGRQQTVDRAPSVATVITASDIRAMGATSLEQALESVPGMHVSVSSYAYTPILSIRGIDTTYNPHVLLLINGVPMNTAFLGNRGPGWGGLPVENVERIEVTEQLTDDAVVVGAIVNGEVLRRR